MCIPMIWCPYFPFDKLQHSSALSLAPTPAHSQTCSLYVIKDLQMPDWCSAMSFEIVATPAFLKLSSLLGSMTRALLFSSRLSSYFPESSACSVSPQPSLHPTAVIHVDLDPVSVTSSFKNRWRQARRVVWISCLGTLLSEVRLKHSYIEVIISFFGNTLKHIFGLWLCGFEWTDAIS